MIDHQNACIRAKEIPRGSLPIFHLCQPGNQLRCNFPLPCIQSVLVGGIDFAREGQAVLCGKGRWIAYDSIHPATVLAGEVKIERLPQAMKAAPLGIGQLVLRAAAK